MQIQRKYIQNIQRGGNTKQNNDESKIKQHDVTKHQQKQNKMQTHLINAKSNNHK